MSAGTHQDRALLADQPCPQLSALQGKPCFAQQLARVVPDEVAEEAECSAIRGILRRADRLHSAGTSACLKMQNGDPVAEKDRRNGKREWLDPDEQRRGQPEGDDDPDAPQRPDPALASKAPLICPPPPRHRGGFGEYRLHP